MGKGLLRNFLCLIIGIFILHGYAEASTEALSNAYTSLAQCNFDKDKFNLEYPEYVRSSCFQKEGSYYYGLCQKGDTCTSASSIGVAGSSVAYTGGSNPYVTKVSSSLKSKLDAIILALENKKKQETPTTMNTYLDSFLVKISSLKNKYSGEVVVGDMLGYLEYEVKRIKSELNQGTETDTVGNFFCDLMGKCTVTATSTGGIAQTTQIVRPAIAAQVIPPATTVSQYPGCNTPDIVLSNGQVWSACNVGASMAGTGVQSYGNMYKWGNNTAVSSANWPTLEKNINAWGDGIGPCASGYKLGTKSDWDTTYALLNNNYSELIKKLIIPMSGLGVPYDPSLINSYRVSENELSVIWSTEKKVTIFHESFGVGTGDINLILSVRCIKSTNDGIVPTTPPTTPPVISPVISPTTPPVTTCDGTLPTGAGVESSPYTNITAGGGSTSNTTWMYVDDATRINKVGCTWSCNASFTKSGDSCIQKAAGSGLKIEVVDMDGNPLSGVNIDVIMSLYNSTGVQKSVTTDSTGNAPEIFLNKTGNFPYLLEITKVGYTIADATGCTDRITSGHSYCDGISLNSTVKIYLSNGVVVTPLSGTMYVSQKNSLTYNVSGLTQTNGQFCLEVLAHTQQYQSAINTGNCNDASKYTSFSEFPGAYYGHTMWILPVPYNESIFGAPGIQVRVFVKNTTTGNVVSFDLFTKN